MLLLQWRALIRRYYVNYGLCLNYHLQCLRNTSPKASRSWPAVPVGLNALTSHWVCWELRVLRSVSPRIAFAYYATDSYSLFMFNLLLLSPFSHFNFPFGRIFPSCIFSILEKLGLTLHCIGFYPMFKILTTPVHFYSIFYHVYS